MDFVTKVRSENRSKVLITIKYLGESGKTMENLLGNGNFKGL
jgi:hypothetical protein